MDFLEKVRPHFPNHDLRMEDGRLLINEMKTNMFYRGFDGVSESGRDVLTGIMITEIGVYIMLLHKEIKSTLPISEFLGREPYQEDIRNFNIIAGASK